MTSKRKINVSVESIMVVLLLIIFAASMCILIFEGSKTYRTILTNKNNEENMRIVLSYVNMRIKQNDVIDHIEVDPTTNDHHGVLIIHHHGDEEGLLSYIYSKDGYLWECYTDGALDDSLSSEIIPIDNVTFRYNDSGNQVITTVKYESIDGFSEITQLTTLRSY